MQLTKKNKFRILRCLCFLIGISIIIFLYKNIMVDVINTILSVKTLNPLIDVNVYALAIPIAAIGVFIPITILNVMSIYYGEFSDYVFSKKTYKIITQYIPIFFVIIGLVFAIYTYNWIIDIVKNNGYTYCDILSRKSVMGKHDVYVNNMFLCKAQ